MAATERSRFLILCKTYPSPSAKYNETSCVAAIREDGKLIRLFPIPYRLLDSDVKFTKWQWIEAVVKKSTDDHRIESYKISIDTIALKDKINTKFNWKDRYYWLEMLKLFHNFNDINAAQKTDLISLALLKPARIDKIELVPTIAEWTVEEKDKLLRDDKIDNLFIGEASIVPKKILRKIPFDFYYHYTCIDAHGMLQSFKHKIVDWEVGALYWTCLKLYKTQWETKFREKLEQDFSEKNLYFLMGNMHRFQNQWLIISLLYPPKKLEEQLGLF